MKTLTAAVVCGALAISACATSPEKNPNYVSPERFMTFECTRIDQELIRVAALLEQNKPRSKGDGALTPLFFLSLLTGMPFIPPGYERAQRYEALTFEHDALKAAAVQKRCEGHATRRRR